MTTPAEQIAIDLRQLPDEVRRKLRPALRAAGLATAVDAKGRSSWSTRIPGTIRVSTSFQADKEGVTVRAGGPNAPHARIYEGGGRHPVFGDREEWVAVTARPYLNPAARATELVAAAAVRGVIDDAVAGIGFTG